MADQSYLERFQERYRQYQVAERRRKTLLLVGGAVTAMLPCITLAMMVRHFSIVALVALVIALVAAIIVAVFFYRCLPMVQARPIVRATLEQIGYGQLVASLQQNTWRRRALLALLLTVSTLLSLLVYLLIDRYWSESPLEVRAIPAIVVLFVLYQLGAYLLDRLQPERRDQEISLVWRLLSLILIILVMILVVSLEYQLKRWTDNPQDQGDWSLALGFAAGSLPFLVHLVFQSLLPTFWVMGAVKRGDYDRALRRVRIVRRLMPHDTSYVLLESAILLFGGRPAAAEALLVRRLARQAWGMHQDVSHLLEHLGHALMAQSRNDQARLVLEAAIAIMPDYGAPYSGLAELDLLQGQHPQRALALAERAVELARSSLTKKVAHQERLGEILSVKAWALAVVGRHLDTEEVLQEALKKTDRRAVYRIAQLHYRWGQVRELAGDRGGACEHYAEAQAVDPGGAYGRLAAAALERLRRF